MKPSFEALGITAGLMWGYTGGIIDTGDSKWKAMHWYDMYFHSAYFITFN